MQNKSKWLFEYSKKIVRNMSWLFVAHIIFCDILMLITHDTSSMGQVTDSVTLVENVCLGGYLFKAALENVFKIKTHPQEEQL